MVFSCLRYALFTCLLLTASAQAAELILVGPKDEPTSGAPLRITAYFNNDSTRAEQITIPAELVLKLSATDISKQRKFTLASGAGTVMLAPKSFRKAEYVDTLPLDLAGTITIEAVKPKAARLVIAVKNTAAPKELFANAPALAPTTPPEQARRLQDEVAISQKTNVDPEPSPLETHEPIYFLLGSREHMSARFQMSLKYRMFQSSSTNTPLVGGAARHGAYFGYTQTSVWDWQASSAPFRDTSYRPSLFYFGQQLVDDPQKSRLGLQSGVEHESNGKAGNDSRSINIAFVRPIWRDSEETRYGWTVAPKFWSYLSKQDNPDIQKYRGYFDLQVKYGKRDGWEISTNLRKGTEKGYGSSQVDLSVPVGKIYDNGVGTRLQLQYFNGYGEDILNYNQHLKSQLRIGVRVVN